ncbi:hypothetical protein Hte_006335 [Hypoxylon texense]
MLLLPRIATSLPDSDDDLVPNPDMLRLGPATVAVTWTLTAVCIVVVAARLYVRSRVTCSIGSDDWIMLAAVIGRIATQAVMQKMYDNDLGNGENCVTYQKQKMIFKYNWLQLVLSIPVSVLARVSATILLVRIFDRQRWLKLYLITFTALLSVVAFATMITFCVQCRPINAFWDPILREDGRATCWDPKVLQYFTYIGRALFTFSDLTYVLFPVIVIWKLNMPLSQRIGLTMVMMLSLLTMGASIVKLIASQVLSATGPGDVWWANLSCSTISSGAEQSSVIVLGSVPPLLATFKTGFVRLRDALVSLGGYVSERIPTSKLRSRLESSDCSSKDSSKPGHRRSRPVDPEKRDLTNKEPNNSLNLSGNVSDPDLQARMNIWRTDSYVVTYEKIGP